MAIGPDGPTPLHHRIEHAIQVNDGQLARMAAMDIAAVIHLDGADGWLLDDGFLADFDRDNPSPSCTAMNGSSLAWVGTPTRERS